MREKISAWIKHLQDFHEDLNLKGGALRHLTLCRHKGLHLEVVQTAEGLNFCLDMAEGQKIRERISARELHRFLATAQKTLRTHHHHDARLGSWHYALDWHQQQLKINFYRFMESIHVTVNADELLKPEHLPKEFGHQEA
ncbi:MAG: hypothetical protein RL095_1884 [Verrucomicrobiota bacterium]|jgi:hypothetical protein